MLAALLLVGACRTPTQIEIEITTDLACSELRGVTVTAGPPDDVEGAPVSTATTDCREEGGTTFVGTIVVAPQGEKSSPVAIKIVAGVNSVPESCTAETGYAGCIVARRRLNYVPHTELKLLVPLSRACIDVACTPDSTCVDASCKDATIDDPSQCEGTGCGEDVLEGGGSQGGGGAAGGAGGEGGSGGGPENDFVLLGAPPGSPASVAVHAVSDDGQVVVGAGDAVPHVWRDGVVTPLAAAIGSARATSDSGDIVAGSLDLGTGQVAVTWSYAGGAYGQAVEVTPSQSSTSVVNACDATCAVTAGTADGFALFVTPSTTLTFTSETSQILALSGDAFVLAGSLDQLPSLWTYMANSFSSVFVDVAAFAGGSFTAVTVDGSLAVGATSGLDAFFVLDPVSGAATADAMGTGMPRGVARTSTGWRAVGTCMATACAWDDGQDPVTLASIVPPSVDLQGATLRTADAITPDGQYIVGVATSAMGELQAYRLRLPL